MITNEHPVDELKRLRGMKAEIDARIEALRALVLELPERERVGREARAIVVSQNRHSLDIKLVTYEMGKKWVEERSTQKQITVVRIEELK